MTTLDLSLQHAAELETARCWILCTKNMDTNTAARLMVEALRPKMWMTKQREIDHLQRQVHDLHMQRSSLLHPCRG